MKLQTTYAATIVTPSTMIESLDSKFRLLMKRRLHRQPSRELEVFFAASKIVFLLRAIRKTSDSALLIVAVGANTRDASRHHPQSRLFEFSESLGEDGRGR